jgi:hypothetical protein
MISNFEKKIIRTGGGISTGSRDILLLAILGGV